MSVRLTPEAIDWIIDVTCKDRSYGARPLRRAIQRHVEDPLAEELIRGRLRGGEIEVYLEGGALAYRRGRGARRAGRGRPAAFQRRLIPVGSAGSVPRRRKRDGAEAGGPAEGGRRPLT